MSAGAEFKVGNASYIRYFHEGDTYVSIAGHSFKDKDQTWKVKVDKKTGRRFYVNLGKHGRSWTLPDTRDKAGLPEGAPGAATPSPAAPSDHASATPHSAPRHMGRAGSSNRLKRVPSPAASPVHEQGRGTGVAATPADPRTPEKNINESISLLEVYKLRTPFNPTEAVANAEVSLPLIEGVAGELERVSDELRLTPEGVLSVVLSALHYLRVKPLADPASTVQKLCYAVASDSKADALSSPFLEVQSKIDYLVSINESMNTSISEQSFDLSVIRTNIELRERERDKAAAKLSEWKSKCSDADGEVDEASEESHRTTRLVEAHLANIRTVTQMLRTAFPSDAQACLAHVEKLKAELQEACNSARSLGDSYKRVKALRGTLHRKLESMSRCDEPNEQQQAHVIESLRAELARQKDDNAKLLLKLSKASIESEQGPQQGRDELRTAKAAVRTLQEESTALRTKCKKLEAHIIETRCHETSDSRPSGAGFESPTVDGRFSSEPGDRETLLHIINQQRRMVETLAEENEDSEDGLLKARMVGKCLAAAQSKIRQQRAQIKDLKSLLNLCLDLRDSADDPVRALINASVSSAGDDDDEPVMLDSAISPRDLRRPSAASSLPPFS